MASATSVIVCKDLKKSYADVEAVRGLDLEVHAGECFGLLGPNGAGKTTTIEILEGLLEPTSGEVRLFDTTWEKDEAQLRARIGITLQETRLTEKLTVEETFAMFRSFYSKGPTTSELLAKVQLEEKKKARIEALSGGQKQRVAVGCALAGSPDLLFLDEPTTGLDPQSRRSLWDLVLDFKARSSESGGKGTILLTTHYMDEAEKLCDRIGIVDHGKRIAIGTPRELIRSLGGEEIIDFAVDGEIELEVLSKVDGVVASRKEAEGFVLTTSELHQTLPALFATLGKLGLLVKRLATHRATLEDVFVHLTGKKLRE